MTEANVVYITFDEAGYEDVVEIPSAAGNYGDDGGYDDIEVEPQAELATTSLPANKNSSISKKFRTLFMMTIINTLVILVVIGLIVLLFTKEPPKTEPVEGLLIEGPTNMGSAATTPEQLTTTEADKTPDRSRHPFPYNGYTYNRTWLNRTWNESRSYCQQIGGDLASVGMKNYTLRRMISSYLELEDAENVWVGAYDFHSEGKWVWVDGSAVDAATAEWQPGNPDNYRGVENCGQILPAQFNDRLNDDKCDNRYAAICETKTT